MIEVAVYCDVGHSMQSIKMVAMCIPVRIWTNYCELRQDCVLYSKGQLAKAKFLTILIVTFVVAQKSLGSQDI